MNKNYVVIFKLILDFSKKYKLYIIVYTNTTI